VKNASSSYGAVEAPHFIAAAQTNTAHTFNVTIASRDAKCAGAPLLNTLHGADKDGVFRAQISYS